MKKTAVCHVNIPSAQNLLGIKDPQTAQLYAFPDMQRLGIYCSRKKTTTKEHVDGDEAAVVVVVVSFVLQYILDHVPTSSGIHLIIMQRFWYRVHSKGLQYISVKFFSWFLVFLLTSAGKIISFAKSPVAGDKKKLHFSRVKHNYQPKCEPLTNLIRNIKVLIKLD